MKEITDYKQIRVRENSLTIALMRKFGGDIQVKCKYGFIDWINDDTIYELKNLNKYKEAIGQFLVYSVDLPEMKLGLITFGVVTYNKYIVKEICKKYNIKYYHIETLNE